MKWDWTSPISRDELELGKSAMLTNMVAGDNLAIARWRYSVIGSFIYTLLRIVAYCVRHPVEVKNIDENENNTLFIYFTPTSLNATSPLEDRYGGRYIGFRGSRCANLPLRRMLLAIMFALRSLIIWRWVKSDARWRPWISDVIIYLLVRRWASVRFKDSKRTTFVYSNDHCCFDRGIVDPVAAFGHVTIYVQHAPVTGIFPPLSADYSLLDGEQALQTYQGIEGSRGTALICGRQYHITGIRKRRAVSKSALICTSTIDTPDSWKPVMAAIKRAGYRVALRTHPSERKNRDWKRLAAELGVEWLDAKEMSLVACLEQFSVVLAGQSGVLLDASLSGAVSILVQFPHDTALGLYDYYGFARTGVAYIAEPKQIGDILRKVEEDGFASLPGPTFFDAANVLETNMQIKAVGAILADKADVPGLIASGFVSRPGNSSKDLKIFVPAEMPDPSSTSV